MPPGTDNQLPALRSLEISLIGLCEIPAHSCGQETTIALRLTCISVAAICGVP